MGRAEALKLKDELVETAKNYCKGKIPFTTGVFKRMFQSSIYEPHQGKRETARRLKRMKTLQKDVNREDFSTERAVRLRATNL